MDDGLILVVNAVSVIRFNRLVSSDSCSSLTNELTIDALDDDFKRLRLRKGDSVRSDNVDRMREADVQRHLVVAVQSDLVTDAVDDEALFKALGDAHNHVVNKSAIKAVQSAMIFVVGVTSAKNVSVFNLDVDGLVDHLAERAQRTCHRHEMIVDCNLYTLGNLDRCSTDS